jgi:predicted membrane metal-binding protein
VHSTTKNSARFVLALFSVLLAVSGQNVAFVAGGVLLVAWMLGISRLTAELAALAGKRFRRPALPNLRSVSVRR